MVLTGEQGKKKSFLTFKAARCLHKLLFRMKWMASF